MNKERRTPLQVSIDMFYERKKKGDLIIIAKTDPSYWCECSDNKCTCNKPKNLFEFRETFIYRSIGKPDLCFYYRQTIDEDFNCNVYIYRLEYEHLIKYLDDDVYCDSTEYNVIMRKKKLKKILANLTLASGEGAG